MSSLIVSGTQNTHAWSNIQYKNMFLGTTDNPNSYVSAIIGAFWAYSGYDATSNIIEEIKHPFKRNMVGSAVISMMTVSFVYVLTNFSYFLLLTPTEILATDAVAITFGAKFSVAFALALKAFVCLSIFGSINIGLINGSRMGLAAARRRHLPRQLSLVNVNRYNFDVNNIIYIYISN